MPNGATRLLMLVDDEPAQQRLVAALVSRAGWRTIVAGDPETALAMLGTHEGMQLDAVLVDQAVPEEDPAALVEQLRARRPGLPVIVTTSIASVSNGVEAIRAGAFDFLLKPIAPERLVGALEAAANDRGEGELRPLAEKIREPLAFEDFAGSEPNFRKALAIAAKAARTRAPVLIEGEPGTGKEMVAQAIHSASARARKPFLTVSCATANGHIESELFGHEPGAFAGAFTRQTGKIVQADGGTLFIDEVERLPAEAQVKLLAAIQDGAVQPVGSHGYREVSTRIVAATSTTLLDEVQAGRFREDLYYRLAVVQLSLPPLRDRKGDIPPLAQNILSRIGQQPGLAKLGISEDALALLRAYDWPGNVRQLHNALFRASVLCESQLLTPADFPDLASRAMPEPVNGQSREAAVALLSEEGEIRPLAEIEADVIRHAIGLYHGRMAEVARKLGIGRSTLYRKLEELGISDVA